MTHPLSLVALRLRNEAFDAIETFAFQNFDKLRARRLLVNLSSDVMNVAIANRITVQILLQAPFMIIFAVALSD